MSCDSDYAPCVEPKLSLTDSVKTLLKHQTKTAVPI